MFATQNSRRATPGSSPELAIVGRFRRGLRTRQPRQRIRRRARRRKALASNANGFGSPASSRGCDYYHYRGRQFESAWVPYSGARMSGSPLQAISSSASPMRATRRAKLAHRKVTLVGRFYDLCAAADRRATSVARSELADGVRAVPLRRGQGMMLTDVRVAEVHDNAPAIPLGELNRSFFGELFRRRRRMSAQRWSSAYAHGRRRSSAVRLPMRANFSPVLTGRSKRKSSDKSSATACRIPTATSPS